MIAPLRSVVQTGRIERNFFGFQVYFRNPCSLWGFSESYFPRLSRPFIVVSRDPEQGTFYYLSDLPHHNSRYHFCSSELVNVRVRFSIDTFLKRNSAMKAVMTAATPCGRSSAFQTVQCCTFGNGSLPEWILSGCDKID